MTVLNFIVHEKAVYLVTDSAFSDPADMRPARFVTKAYLIIAGTGIMAFIANWFIAANTDCVASDMAHLDGFASKRLRSIWAGISPEVERRGQHHDLNFGCDRAVGRIVPLPIGPRGTSPPRGWATDVL